MHILLCCNSAAASNATVWSPGVSRASGGCQTLMRSTCSVGRVFQKEPSSQQLFHESRPPR